MKDFLKYTLASVTGIVIVGIIMCVLGVVSLIGIVASEQSTTTLKENSVLTISLSGILQERTQEDDIFSQLTNSSATTNISLKNLLSSIRTAKNSDEIKGIYIESGMFSPDSYASLQAIRHELEEFKKSGKWIVTYSDTYTQSSYYLCSVADKVFLNPQGMIEWHGLAAQPYFYKDLMAKFGIKMQLSKVGKYKSAPEMFTADKMSDANREQISEYINGTWATIVSDVSTSRKVSANTLNEYADSLITFADPQSYVAKKLVDKLLYADEMRSELKKMLKVGEDETINQVSVADINNLPAINNKGSKIAVYYAFGEIVQDNQGLYDNACIASNKMCKDLEELMNDDDIKAVVIRVNSGGGSAYASEQIWHSVMKLKAKKPVVISMGGMAASGAYYFSAAANYIFAEPTTLTGSIGIFGMFPDLSGLLTDKLGIKFDEVKTNKNSAFGTPARPFNEEEMSYLNAFVDRGYQLFRKRVADGRHMSIDAVEEVAQGRVWLAKDAQGKKLVDGMGGLYDAIDKAAKLAKVDTYHPVSYPDMPGLLDKIINVSSNRNYLDEGMKQVLGEYYSPFMLIKTIDKQDAIQARIPFEINIK